MDSPIPESLVLNAGVDSAVVEPVLLSSLKRMAALSRDVAAGVDLYGRVKTNHSTAKKMLRDGLGAHEILDIIGIRALTEHVSDCYRLIRAIHSEFPALAGEFDDYIATPKPNGYRSLHTTVLTPCGSPIEVQVRTHAMHAHAERGAASHVHYKELQASEASRG